MLKGSGSPSLSAIPVIGNASSRQQCFLESEDLHLEPSYSPFFLLFLLEISLKHITLSFLFKWNYYSLIFLNGSQSSLRHHVGNGGCDSAVFSGSVQAGGAGWSHHTYPGPLCFVNLLVVLLSPVFSGDWQ